MTATGLPAVRQNSESLLPSAIKHLYQASLDPLFDPKTVAIIGPRKGLERKVTRF